MLQEDHYRFLDQLRFGQSFSERKDALISLKALEDSGITKESDIKALLEDIDPVTQHYAIGASGRLQCSTLIPRLIAGFTATADPATLLVYIEAFINYNQVDFIKPTINKIIELKNNPEVVTNGIILQGEFILDQIIIPCLKLIELQGYDGNEKLIVALLSEQDNNVRWHALKIINKHAINLPQKKLHDIVKNDASLLNRELAAIMLEK